MLTASLRWMCGVMHQSWTMLLGIQTGAGLFPTWEPPTGEFARFFRAWVYGAVREADVARGKTRAGLMGADLVHAAFLEHREIVVLEPARVRVPDDLALDVRDGQVALVVPQPLANER